MKTWDSFEATGLSSLKIHLNDVQKKNPREMQYCRKLESKHLEQNFVGISGTLLHNLLLLFAFDQPEI